MKCFIYWTAELKSSKPWSSQFWTQFKQLRTEVRKSQDFNGVWTGDLAIPVRRSNTLGAGHLLVLMSPWSMDVKWSMKCFIYLTADLKSSELWSSQLWMQFKQLHIEAWKSQDFHGFEPVTLSYYCDTLTNWRWELVFCKLWWTRKEWMWIDIWNVSFELRIKNQVSYEGNLSNCI